MSVLMSYHRHIDRTRVQFDYLSFRQTDVTFEEEILTLGGKVYHFSRPNLKADFYKKVDRFFEKHANEYAVVHCHPIYTAAIFGKAARRHGVSHVIQHSHSTRLSEKFLSQVRNFAMLSVFRHRATEYAACSEAAKKIFFWKKPEEVYLMRNAIDVGKFTFSPEKRAARRKELGIGEDTLVLGHVGRFSKEKNHGFLLEVFAEVLKQRPDAKLLLIGDGVLFEAIKTLSAEKGLAQSVIFAGRQQDVAGYMSAMDVFLVPSLFEGLGIVLIEAQANGLPCLAANTIPSECAVGGEVVFLPLDYKEEWAIQTLKSLKCRHCGQLDTLTEAGYNIDVEANGLARYYLSLI